MKINAKNRSQRLRKKLRVDEYQELGFDLAWQFKEGTSNEEIDQFINKFFDEVIIPNGLGFGGEGDLIWHGLVCTEKLGSCTEEQRKVVEDWLNASGVNAVAVSPLYDVWWAQPAN